MVRANGREGVVPANRDPMDTLSVGADKAPFREAGLSQVTGIFREVLSFNL
jgi:hypothetical protein